MSLSFELALNILPPKSFNFASISLRNPFKSSNVQKSEWKACLKPLDSYPFHCESAKGSESPGELSGGPPGSSQQAHQHFRLETNITNYEYYYEYILVKNPFEIKFQN